MRVLITVPRLDVTGGISNYYRTLRAYLDDQMVYFEIGALPGESGRLRQLRRLLADYWRFHQTLRRGPFDLIHVNPSMESRSILRDGLFLLIARAHGYPVLVFYRGWMPPAEAAVRRFPWLFRFVYSRSRANVVLADEFRVKLKALGIRDPFHIETTVVDDSVLDSIGGESLRDHAEGRCGILYLGRLDTGKGLPEAIAAFAALQARYPEARLAIAGDGPERANAEAEVARRGLKGVTFLGHVQGAAKMQAYRDADLYLFTSLAEGMPNTVLEAMAFGLPVITRRVGGIRDFFEDGRMGYSTDSRDPADYAALLGRLIADPTLRQAMGRYNRGYARQRFSASVVVRRLLAIYERTIDCTRPESPTT